MNSTGTFELFLIGVGLAMDAFAVSVSSGVTIRRMRLHHAMQIALFFGMFQAIMPLLGWWSGRFFSGYIEQYDHWVAFILLSFVGGKMIYEAKSIGDDPLPSDPLNVYVLFTLAIATSIDALAVGVTFSFLAIHIWEAIAIIGLVTFVLSFIGTQIGKTFGHLFENRLELAGGLILVGIGIKILIQHLFFPG